MMKRVLCIFGALIAVFALLILPIGAEVTPPTPPSYISSVDWLSYPGSNLMPFPYTNLKTVGSSYSNNGVLYTLSDDGIIISTGSANPQSYMIIATNVVLEAGIYSFSTFADGCYLFMDLYDPDSGSFVRGDGRRLSSFTTEFEQTFRCNFYLVVGNGTVVTDLHVYPTINAGSINYPYQPYLPYYFQQAFNAGWNQAYTLGYQHGYDAGYDDGYHLVNRDLISPMETWTYAEVVIGYMNTSVSSSEQFYTERIMNDPDVVAAAGLIVNNQFSITQIVSNFLDSLTVTGSGYILCSSCTLSVYFDDEPLVPSLYSFVGFYPPSTSFRISALNNDTVMREVTLSSSSAPESVNDVAYKYAQSFADFDLSIDQIVVSCIGGTSMDSPQTIEEIGFTLGIIDNPNQLAYSQGLEAGLSLSADKAYAAGERAGYNDGYRVGKEEGLRIADTGTWTELMTSVAEAPINTFQSLFNFEILGLDMRAAFGSVLALCVVLIIVKKVIL